MTPVQIINLALGKIGDSQKITAVDDGSRAAAEASLIYDHTLRATLRAFPWSFATKYRALTLTQGPAWDDDAPVQDWSSTVTYAVGDVVTNDDVVYYCILAHLNQEPPNATYWSTTATEYANGDWMYAYRWPTDCIFVRRVVPGGGMARQFNATPIEFRIGRDANGLLVYTHEQDATIEYTTIDCTSLYADDLFIDAFSSLLASKLAPVLSRIDKMEQRAYAMFKLAIQEAAAVSSREQQLHKPGEADHIRARG